jgi:hypothetical protein
MCAGLDLGDADTVATIENALDLAASDVHAALAAVGACDCTIAGWAETYLKKLNIIDAAVIHNCPCGNTLSDEEKQVFLQWLETQFTNIRQGKTEVCEGETGAEFPAFGGIQYSFTEGNTKRLIRNELLKDL